MDQFTKTDCRFCCSPRRRGWRCLMPDVQSSNSHADTAEVSQLRSRSAVSVPTVAGQSACPRDPRNQNGALRSSVASVRRETDRNDSPGVLGPNLILDGSRSGGEAPSLPELFQSASRSLGLGRTAARAWCKHSDIRLCFIPVAAALSRTLSDSYCRVIGAIRQ